MLIIGGGPAGLYAAQRLAHSGLMVRVLEEHDGIGDPVHCTGIVSTAAFALSGVPRGSLLRRERLARFHSPAGHSFSLSSPDEDVCIIDRRAFDRGLAAAARAVGATVTTGARAFGLHVDERRVVVEAEVGGERREFVGQACVLATGARYRFQRQLGWGIPSLILSSAQVELASVPVEGFDLLFRADTAPDGFAWVAPVVREGVARAKVGVMVRHHPQAVLGRVVEDLRRDGRITESHGSTVVRPMPLAPLARTYGDRVLAVGDAAGLVKPTTGGGIYYSLLSAVWAAEALTRAFRAGELSARSLALYEENWRKRLGRELRVGVWLRRLAARLTSGEIDRLVELATHGGVVPVLRRSASFNWHANLILELLRHPGVFRILGERFFMRKGVSEAYAPIP